VIGSLLILVGVWLSLGNGNSLSPSSYFSEVPVLRALRSFARYQILIVLGLAICTAVGVADIERRVTGGSWRTLVQALLVGLVVLPVAVHAATLASAIHTESSSALLSRFPPAAPGPPRMMRKSRPAPRYGRVGSQTALLAEGFWIVNCYTNLKLPPPRVFPHIHTSVPISNPPPIAVEAIGHNSMRLRYPVASRGEIRFNLRAPGGLTVNAPSRRGAREFLFVERGGIPDGLLEIAVDYPGPAAGVRMSLAGVAACALFVVWIRRRETPGEFAASF